VAKTQLQDIEDKLKKLGLWIAGTGTGIFFGGCAAIAVEGANIILDSAVIGFGFIMFLLGAYIYPTFEESEKR